MIPELRRLYAYTVWANARTFAAAGELPPAERDRAVGGSFPTLLGTLAHVALAEWVWLRRWQGESPKAPPPWSTAPNLSGVRAGLTEVETERTAFLAGLAEPDLDRRIAYRLLAGVAGEERLGDLLLHVVNHSTYHRGQAATQLRLLGRTPPATDLLFFPR